METTNQLLFVIGIIADILTIYVFLGTKKNFH